MGITSIVGLYTSVARYSGRFVLVGVVLLVCQVFASHD